MNDPFAYLVNAGWPVELLQQNHISKGRTVAEVAEAVESMVARGITMEEIIAEELHGEPPAEGFAGFARSGERENENGFCEFCYFCGPDISKNPYFPHNEFSDELRNFSAWVCMGLQVPIDMPSVSTLAATSLCA